MDFPPALPHNLFGFNGRLNRLHKGEAPDPPPPPVKPGKPAQTVDSSAQRDPNKRKQRGSTSTILTTGASGGSENSILGG